MFHCKTTVVTKLGYYQKYLYAVWSKIWRWPPACDVFLMTWHFIHFNWLLHVKSRYCISAILLIWENAKISYLCSKKLSAPGAKTSWPAALSLDPAGDTAPQHIPLPNACYFLRVYEWNPDLSGIGCSSQLANATTLSHIDEVLYGRPME